MKTLLLLASFILSTSAFAAQNINISVANKMVAQDVTPAPTNPPTPAPVRTVDRYSYNFGSVRVGMTQYIRYTLTNTGTTPLTFDRALIGGIGFDAYHSCDVTLQPNEKCSFEISYNPPFEGMHSGQFVLSFVENLDIVVDLWGSGTRF